MPSKIGPQGFPINLGRVSLGDGHEKYAPQSLEGLTPRKHPSDVPLMGEDPQIHQTWNL